METITIIGPVFFLVLVGYVFGNTPLFKPEAKQTLITYLWYVAIPTLIFSAMATNPLPSRDELLLVVAYYSGLFFLYGFSMAIAKWIFQRPLTEQSVFAFSICFGNGVFIGLPVVHGVYGDEGVRLFLILLSFHSSSLLTVSTIFMERSLHADKPLTDLARDIGLSIIKNPILMSLIAGILWAWSGLPFPELLDRITALPAASAAPVGLFTAGLALGGVRIAGDMTQAIIGSLFKLLLAPLIIFAVAHYGMHLPPVWVGVATLMAALPSGIIAYSFALQYNTAPRRAASIVLISTAGSIFTLAVLIEMLK